MPPRFQRGDSQDHGFSQQAQVSSESQRPGGGHLPGHGHVRRNGGKTACTTSATYLQISGDCKITVLEKTKIIKPSNPLCRPPAAITSLQSQTPIAHSGTLAHARPQTRSLPTPFRPPNKTLVSKLTVGLDKSPVNDSHRPPRSALLLAQSTLGSSSSPGFTPGPTYAGPSSGTRSEPHAVAPGAPSGNQSPEARVLGAHGRPLQGVTPMPPNHHCRPDPSPVISLVQYVKPHYGHLTIKSAPALLKLNSAPIPTLSREHRSRRSHQAPQKEPCNSSFNSLCCHLQYPTITRPGGPAHLLLPTRSFPPNSSPTTPAPLGSASLNP